MAKVEAKKTPAKKTVTKKTVPTKTVAKKDTPTKAVTKKVAPTKEVIKKATISKTVVAPKEIKQQVEKSLCKYCREDFDKGLVVCPFCRRSQKDKTGPVLITILSIILLISITVLHFIEKYNEDVLTESEYKYQCSLASYEDLVRTPKELKNKNVKVIGKVLSVEGYDYGKGNVMSIQIDANLFEGPSEQIIEFEYIDDYYNAGFIEGDIITVYGNYESINGNTPFIKAKYIVLGT